MTSERLPLEDDSDARLERVDEILGEVAEQLREGVSVRAEDVYSEHPDLEHELRLVLPSVLKLEGAARHAPEHVPPETIGRYRVLRELGRGGMGVVYEAEDDELDRRVAVKWISPHVAGEPRFLERFRREAQTAARLSHENVVPVHEVGECAGRPFFAMQLVDGHGLDALLRVYRGEEERDSARRIAWEFATREGSGAPSGESGTRRARVDVSPSGAPELGRAYHRAVAQLVHQVARALEYAHERGVLHRDVKPANILLDTGGRAWVADFGLAKLGDEGDVTREGDLIGTLRYMAPEQFDGHADARTDVYGLGLVLYELLALRPAFQGESREHLVQKALYERPRRVRAIRPEVPLDLERITAKATAKIPEERYGSAHELAADLEAFLQGRPISARMPGMWYLARLAVARNRPLAWVLLAVLLVMLVAVPTYVLQLRESNRVEARLAYLGNLAGASASLHAGDVPGARKRLEACAGRLCGWEWRHLFARLDQSVSTLGRFEHPINDLIVGEGGLTVAHGRDLVSLVADDWVSIVEQDDGPNWMNVWSVQGERRALDRLGGLWALEEDGVRSIGRIGTSHIVCAGVSPDGSTLALHVFGGGLKRVDARTGEVLDVSDGNGAPNAFALSEDGRRIYSAAGNGLVQYLAEGAQAWETLYRDAGPLHLVALSPDENRLAVSGVQNSVLVIDTLDGRVVHTLVGHKARVRALRFGPRGRRLYSAGGDTAIRAWDLERGILLRTWSGHARGVSALALDSSGDRLFSGSVGGGVKEWDVHGAGGMATFVGHVRDVGALDLTVDGARVATGDRGGTIRIHDLETESLEALLLGHRRPVSSVRFHAGGLVSSSYDQQVIRWDAVRGTQRWRAQLESPVIGLDVSDERGEVFVGTTGGSVVVLSLEDGTELRRASTAPAVPVRRLVLTPSDDQVLLGRTDGSLVRLDSADLSVLSIWSAHSDRVESIAFDPTGRTFVTASADGSLARWDSRHGALLFRRVLESGGATGESDALTDVSFSPDGEQIAVSAHSNLIRLVTADTGEPILDLPGHVNWVLKVRFTPDGEQLVSAGSDAQVRVWGTRSTAEKHAGRLGRQRREREALSEIESVLNGPLRSVSSVGALLDELPGESRAAIAHVHRFRAAHLVEAWTDAVLCDPSRADEAENFLNQLELARAEQPEAPTLAAAVELARDAPGLALSRAHLARQRLGDRPDPLLTLLEARALRLLGEDAEADAAFAQVEAELVDPLLEATAVRVAWIEEWGARWR